MPSETLRKSDVAPANNSENAVWIERIVIVLLFGGLLIGVFEVLRPFTTAILFGGILAIAAWPCRQALVQRAALSRGWAGTLLLLLSIALVAVPLLLVTPHLVEQVRIGVQRAQSYLAAAPEAPAWLTTLPFVGDKLGSAWVHLVTTEVDIFALWRQYASPIEKMLLVVAQGLADSAVQVVLSLAVATTFWINGEAVVDILRVSLRRLGGSTAHQVVDVAAGAIRGVAYGVVGTAAIQAIVLAVGLAVAGVPGAAMLGFLALLLAISQIGAPLLVLIWGGAAWWLLNQEHQLWAILMIIWGVLVSMIDNFIKPWLIGFGVKMPISLTILGVFGGFVAFGFLGLFIGPALIAVMFHILQAWRASALAD